MFLLDLGPIRFSLKFEGNNFEVHFIVIWTGNYQTDPNQFSMQIFLFDLLATLFSVTHIELAYIYSAAQPLCV